MSLADGTAWERDNAFGVKAATAELRSEKRRLKKGDKVRYASVVTPTGEYRDNRGLRLGAVYTVEAPYSYGTGDQYVFLEGINEHTPFNARRFKLVEPAPEQKPEDAFDAPSLASIEAANSIRAEKDKQREVAGPVPSDAVVLPKHYARFKIEPIRFIQENNLTPLQGKIIKYLLRYDEKNGMEDLEKGRRCYDMFIEWVKGNPDWWKAPGK